MRFPLAAAAALVASALISSPAYAQNGPAKAQDTATKICAGCHGENGNSTIAINPVLAGQHPEYLLKQLMNFKSQAGKAAERVNPVMGGMAAPLSAEDMTHLAAFYSSQKPKPRSARDPELAKLGQSIYRGGVMSKGVAACASCHSPNGAGMPAQYPRLAGQHSEYLATQLKAFRSGERANDPNDMMRKVAAKLSDKEISAVAEYISGLR
ncbi:MAG: c-type cytochrome [Burkholderiales bacterium]|nr:c-type cytochrome [Burkholderiales bacterium]MDP2240286.1 c-type cytochrome [Burkholderiales bacterium]